MSRRLICALEKGGERQNQRLALESDNGFWSLLLQCRSLVPFKPYCWKLLQFNGWWEIRSWLSVSFLNIFLVISPLSWKSARAVKGSKFGPVLRPGRGFCWDVRGNKCRAVQWREESAFFIPLAPESVRAAAMQKPASLGPQDRVGLSLMMKLLPNPQLCLSDSPFSSSTPLLQTSESPNLMF